MRETAPPLTTAIRLATLSNALTAQTLAYQARRSKAIAPLVKLRWKDWQYNGMLYEPKGSPTRDVLQELGERV